MRNLVAGIVVKIEDVFPVSGPGVPFNRVGGFVRHAMWVRAVERARPDIQRIAFVGREPAQPRTIGRDFRVRPRRVAEQDFSRNKRR